MDYLCSGDQGALMISCAYPRAQYLTQSKEIESAIHRVLESGSYVLGSEVEKFEKEFARYNKVSHAVGVGSGTEALHIALRALGIGAGDEVITPSHTATATVSAILLAGAKPVFLDIEPLYYTIDPDKLAATLTPKTKAVIPVHIYGHPCDMNAINDIAHAHNIRVIEDCAQAPGAVYSGRQVGSLGDFGCFSFYPTKNLGGIGDGGALITNNDRLANKARSLRQYGWDDNKVSISEGWNSRLDELQAAILRVKLRRLDVDNALRQEHGVGYGSSLEQFNIQLPCLRKNSTHVFHLYAIRVDERDALRQWLRRKGIDTGIHYPVPVHCHDYYKTMLGTTALPVTESIAKEIISLPMYPELSVSERDRVISEIRAYYS